MKIGTTLTHWIIHNRPQGEPETGDFVGLINDISVACKKIAALVDKGALINVLGSADSDNVQGEQQKKLDVISNDVMIDAVEHNGHIDRKSTRLNSSHVAISYAVFCLKKKRK